MTWLVDTNVVLDVWGADATFGRRSAQVLSQCAGEGVLVVNPVVIAELSSASGSLDELDELLPPTLFRRDPIPVEASFLAGRAFSTYTFSTYKRRGGAKGRMLADFLIGAHAAVAGFGLISCDEGYTSYFRLELLNPADAEV